MQTSVTELPDSRVRVEVAVPPDDVGRAISRAARAMAREMRMPGFRKGKAPPSLVIQRVGFGPILEEAIRDSLPEWYERALLDVRHQPDRRPRASRWSRPPTSEGEGLDFKFEVGVRPPAELGEYKGLEVGREEKEVDEEIVDTEVERVREGFARLEPVERAAAEGDSVLIDFEGMLDGKAFEGGKADDYLLALGSGQLIEGFEEQLVGAGPGEEREVEGHLPGRIPGRAPGGRGRGLQGQGQGGAGENPARARRRLRLRRLRVRHARGAARRHPRESRQSAEQPRRGRLPDRRGRRRRRQRDRRGARRPGRPPAPPNAGSGWNASSPRAGWTPTPSCRCRAKRARS